MGVPNPLAGGAPKLNGAAAAAGVEAAPKLKPVPVGVDGAGGCPNANAFDDDPFEDAAPNSEGGAALPNADVDDALPKSEFEGATVEGAAPKKLLLVLAAGAGAPKLNELCGAAGVVDPPKLVLLLAAGVLEPPKLNGEAVGGGLATELKLNPPAAGAMPGDGVAEPKPPNGDAVAVPKSDGAGAAPKRDAPDDVVSFAAPNPPKLDDDAAG